MTLFALTEKSADWLKRTRDTLPDDVAPTSSQYVPRLAWVRLEDLAPTGSYASGRLCRWVNSNYVEGPANGVWVDNPGTRFAPRRGCTARFNLLLCEHTGYDATDGKPIMVPIDRTISELTVGVPYSPFPGLQWQQGNPPQQGEILFFASNVHGGQWVRLPAGSRGQVLTCVEEAATGRKIPEWMTLPINTPRYTAERGVEGSGTPAGWTPPNPPIPPVTRALWSVNPATGAITTANGSNVASITRVSPGTFDVVYKYPLDPQSAGALASVVVAGCGNWTGVGGPTATTQFETTTGCRIVTRLRGTTSTPIDVPVVHMHAAPPICDELGRVDTITTSNTGGAGSGTPTAELLGAWVRCTVDTTTGTITAAHGHNVLSVTRAGPGLYDVVYRWSLGNNVPVTSCDNWGGVGNPVSTTANVTAAGCRVITTPPANLSVQGDVPVWNLHVLPSDSFVITIGPGTGEGSGSGSGSGSGGTLFFCVNGTTQLSGTGSGPYTGPGLWQLTNNGGGSWTLRDAMGTTSTFTWVGTGCTLVGMNTVCAGACGGL